MEKIYDVVIIGGGPGGYTSALYCARAGLSTMVLEKLSAGGQMALTSQIDNYPGFEEGIDGFSLAEKMEQGAERFGAETELAEVLSVDFSNDIKIVESSEGTFKAKTVIIATGAVPRELGVPGEKELVGRGVGYCATCDGMFYRNKTVMVVGGGNTAAEEALYLAGIARSVTLVHRRDELRADKVLQERIKSNPKIIVEWDSVIDDIIGGDNPKGVTEIRVKNLKTDKYKNIAVAGVFIAIGHKPNTEIFKNAIVLDNQGYIVTVPGSCQTSVPGVFAAGDVKDSVYRQAVTAAGSGCQAFLEAQRFLQEE